MLHLVYPSAFDAGRVGHILGQELDRAPNLPDLLCALIESTEPVWLRMDDIAQRSFYEQVPLVSSARDEAL